MNMAAAETANCIMEVSVWNAAGGGGRCFMARRRGCESADLRKGLQPSGGASACSGSGPPFRCGFPSFRGTCGIPPRRWSRAPSHVEEGWGRFRPGPHVAAPRWVGRGCAAPGGPAGSTCGTKAPPPAGGGAPRGGAGGGSHPSEAPGPPRGSRRTFPSATYWGAFSLLEGRGGVSGPYTSPSPDRAFT